MKRCLISVLTILFFTILNSCMTLEGNFEGFTYERAWIDDSSIYGDIKDGVMITRYTGLEKDIVIPAKIKGKNVTAIKSLTYSANMRYLDAAKPKNTTIQSITIPETVKYIFSSAFEDCIALEKIFLQNPYSINNSKYIKVANPVLIELALNEPEIEAIIEAIYNNNGQNIELVHNIEMYLGKRINDNYFLQYNGKIISSIFDRKPSIEIEEYIGNIISIKINDSISILKEDEIISLGKDIKKIEVSISGDIFYIKDYDNKIYKNGDIILDYINGLSTFSIDLVGNNIAYTILERSGRMRLFKNNQEYASTNDMFMWPKLSPDGSKLYYFEVKYGPNRSLLFYVRGPDIPPMISGAYLKPNGFGTFIFSNNSKYVACHVESISRGMEGYFLFLNDQLLGPYRNISKNFYFTEDSKYFIYTHEGIEEKIELK